MGRRGCTWTWRLGVAWAQVWSQEAASSAFSLHFRSLMSLPLTSTPRTPSAQVSVKPTCICLGFYTWPSLWAEGGRAEDRFLSPSPLPFHSRLLRMTDEERARACSQAVLDSRPAAALSWLCDLGETTASLGAEPLPPHLPQGGVIPTWLASPWSGEI